jgi:fructose-specific phosphotransferase system IIA component
MNLHEIISPECVKAPLDHSDKKGVIDELVDLLAAQGKVSDAAAFRETVWTREQTRTTGIGHGLAIPHGKSEAVVELAMAVGKPAEPIDFASIDGKPVKLVVLLASPIDRTSEHIQALARISRLMTVEEFREKIYAATDPGVIYDLLQQQDYASASS